MQEQLEFPLLDWREMSSAPRDCTWVEIERRDGVVVKAHFAEDLSGEEQPSFSGWFVDCGSYFGAVYPKPKRWRPIA